MGRETKTSTGSGRGWVALFVLKPPNHVPLKLKLKCLLIDEKFWT